MTRGRVVAGRNRSPARDTDHAIQRSRLGQHVRDHRRSSRVGRVPGRLPVDSAFLTARRVGRGRRGGDGACHGISSGANLGTGLDDIVVLTVAGVQCLDISYGNDKLLQCVTAPASAPGSGPVVVVTRTTGEMQEEDRTTFYTYNVPPTTREASPSTGPEAGAIPILILGDHLGVSAEDVVDVTIAGSSCISTLVYYNSTVLQCILPAKAVEGDLTDTVIVTTQSGGDGTDTAGARFVYTPTPVVTSIYPPEGSTTGYTVVRITGTGFGESAVDIVDVLVAGVSCRYSLIYESSTSLSCFTGATSEYALTPPPGGGGSLGPPVQGKTGGDETLPVPARAMMG